MNLRVLRVDHYGDTEQDNKRFTLAPTEVVALIADPDDVAIQGRQLRRVTALMKDGMSIDLIVNHADLESLEKAVGAYMLPDDMV